MDFLTLYGGKSTLVDFFHRVEKNYETKKVCRDILPSQ